MGLKPDIRIKLRNFFKKYGKLIGTIALVWFTIIAINKILKISNQTKEPTTTYTPHEAVLDSNEKAPTKVKNSIEDFIEQYIKYCNNEQYTAAYNMLSDECKDYFGSFRTYAAYVSNKFDQPKIYSLQNYSNKDGKYIYNVKLYDDILASGLTNSVYNYQQEKITASYDKDNNVVFSVGNYIGEEVINNVQENDYVKIDVQSKDVKYSTETYKVKITNRSENILVVKNGQVDNEVVVQLDGEIRKDIGTNNKIIIEPGKNFVVELTFNKYFDDESEVQNLIFNSIRVVEHYIEDDPNEENAIDKFSVQLALEE